MICDGVDAQFVKFAYKEASNAAYDEDTSQVIADIVYFYVYCPLEDDSIGVNFISV